MLGTGWKAELFPVMGKQQSGSGEKKGNQELSMSYPLVIEVEMCPKL